MEIKDIESACKLIHDAVEQGGGDYWQKRIAVAQAFGGYADAKFMRHMHETYGLSVADQVGRLSSMGLNIPWAGLRSEFEMMGMKPSSVESMLNEAREFEKARTAATGRPDFNFLTGMRE